VSSRFHYSGNAESGAGPFEGRPAPLDCRSRTVSGGSYGRPSLRPAARRVTGLGFLAVHRFSNRPVAEWNSADGRLQAPPFCSHWATNCRRSGCRWLEGHRPPTRRTPAISGERRQPASAGFSPTPDAPSFGPAQPRKRRNGVAQDALRPGSGSATETPVGGWRQTQLRQGVMPGERLHWGMRKRRSPASGTCAGM